MRFMHFIFALVVYLVSCHVSGQNRININIPNVDSESEYIWSTLQEIKFFDKNNYNINLPQGTLIDELKHKSKLESLTAKDYENLIAFMRDSVYNETDYQKGYEKIKNESTLINKMINQLELSNFDWTFKTFPIYEINLTLYGPGGSYNPDEGSILVYTTPEGQFKNYDNPANTIIHEVVHIGIEESIIAKYAVPHPLKERIVDTFVSLYFGQYLSDYKIQNMGENRTDQYLKKVADLKNLDKIIEVILETKE